MSDDKKKKLPVNIVQPISNESETSQTLHNGSPSFAAVQPESNLAKPSGSSLILPDAPPELIAALSKSTDISEPFTEPFGTVNQYGELVLFESEVTIGRLDKDHSIVDEVPGTVCIIFYPEKGQTQLLLTRTDNPNLFPVTMEILNGSYNFVYYGLGVIQHPYPNRRYVIPKRSLYVGYGYLFGKFCDNSFVIESEIKGIEFKRVIRHIELNVQNKGLSMKVVSKDTHVRLESKFWYLSGLRPVNVKILYIHEVVIGTLRLDKPVWHMHSIVTLVQSKKDKSLRLVLLCIHLAEEVLMDKIDVFRVGSRKWPPGHPYLWELTADSGELFAWEFKTGKEAQDFRTVMNYYVKANEAGKLSWVW